VSKFNKYILFVSVIFLLGMLLSSCNYTKHLTKDQTLIGKTSLQLNTLKKIKYKGEFESAILSYAQPKPNTHLLDLDIMPKFKLWKYNNKYWKYVKDTMNEKITKHKVEPPSLIDTFKIKKSALNMKQFMMNQGYFYAEVSSKIVPTKNPKISNIEYSINAGKNYIIDKVRNETQDANLLFLINKNAEKSFIKKGLPFTNFSCGLERERLYKIFRNSGLYDFKMDNISFIIDTTDRQSLINLSEDPFEQSVNFTQEKKENKTINITVKYEKTKDSSYTQVYHFKNIFVEINDVFAKNTQVAETTNMLDNIHFKYKTLPINRKVIARNIFIQPGTDFNTIDVEATINRLNQLGVFQFVNIRFEKVPDETGQLNCFITLNTSAKMDATVLGDISTSDGDYFLGFGGSVIYKNRNLFSGANQMLLRASYSTEFRNDNLLTGQKRFYLSGNNASVTSEFTFPKFIVPFKQTIFSKKTLPYTIFSINYSLIQRIQNYTIINATGSFGYTWRESNKKQWRLNPSFLTITKVPTRYLGSSFKDKIENNDYLRNIFSDNTIYGENVTYDFKNNPDNELKNNTALRISFEEAGTILKGFNYIYNLISDNNISPIARYIKLETDLRRYIRMNKSEWASRIMIGVGVPIAESEALPYIKRYSAGGAFSNRGWRARTLGPGRSLDTTLNTSYIDRTGDMKFELNSEYRMNLLKLFSGVINLKGALFADIGNIWLFNKSSDIPGGEFDTRYLFRDLAISCGAGFRIDFSFFVFRIDLGFPIKQPHEPKNYGFTFDQLKYSSGIWNIAIGYPF
jgi:outer membrane protein insertion porin family